MAGSSEHGIKRFGFNKMGINDQGSSCNLLTVDYAPWG
jgi:hypothetical protein